MKIFNIHLPKSFLDLSKGHIVSQTIGVFASVLIAKVYGVSALGIFSVFFSALMIFSTLNTARLDAVLFLEQNKKNQENNTIGLLYVVVLLTFIFIGISLLVPNKIIEQYFVDRAFLILIIFAAFLNSIKNTLQNLTLLRENYQKVKYSKIVFTTVRYIFQFVLFYMLSHYWGLVIGYVIAIFIVIIYFHNKLDLLPKNFNPSMFVVTIKKYKGLLSYALPGDLVNAIAINLFPVLLIASYGDKITGNYFMASLILSIPITFLYASVAPVFFKKAVSYIDKNQTRELYLYVLLIVKRIFLLISLPLLILLFIGEEMVVLFFDEEWKTTGVFLEIFSFLFAFRVLYSPISSLEECLNKNHISLIVNIYFVVIMLGSVYFGKSLFSIYQIAKFISVMTSIGYIFLLIYFLVLLRNKSIKTLLVNKK